MLDTKITMKNFDAYDSIKYQAFDLDGYPVNLAGASVKFNMQHITTGQLVSHSDAEIIDASSGMIKYTFQHGDTLLNGGHKAEFEIVFPDGKRKTYPSNQYFLIDIVPSINTGQETEILIKLSDLDDFKEQIDQKVVDTQTQVVTVADKVQDLEAKALPVATPSGFTDGRSIEFEQDKRIHLKTGQKWVEAEGHLSDLIRLQWNADRAKPALVWLDETGADKTAIISHYKANDPTRIDHRHISIETTMSPTGAYADQLFTRFELPFDADICEIQTHDSNFTVVDGKLRVMGGSGSNKELIFGKANSKETNQKPDGTPNYDVVFSPRWTVRADNTAETGSNEGTDFKLVRFNDAAIALDSPLHIKRSNGYVGLVGASPTAPLDVNGNRMRLRLTKTPASATDTGLKGEICYDANFMYVCVADNTWKRMPLSSW
ncbi:MULTISPECIES: BppU family phage baseplate upper protein [Gammaproteobacteria]|uniref:BppU family phage baseplate upper protein n=1 Tax=Acinetobacter sp. HRXRD-152 TaxID=3404808 RepID=UPI003BB7CC54